MFTLTESDICILEWAILNPDSKLTEIRVMAYGHTFQRYMFL